MKATFPQRRLDEIPAILLPFQTNGTPDVAAFLAHIERTYATGLTPAVHMDTGYVHLLSGQSRQDILKRAAPLSPAVPGERVLPARSVLQGTTRRRPIESSEGQ